MDAVPHLPNGENIAFWDADWYHKIVLNGYKVNDAGQSNTAFYILLPWIWKYAHLSNWGMSFVNIILYSIGFSIITILYKIKDTDKLLWLSIPPMFFAFIPYTEALFMLLGSILLWGIRNDERYVIWLSIFFLSLTRPVSMILFPALLIMELTTNDRNNILNSLRNFFTKYGLPLIAGFAFFAWIQYHDTGVWFSFFKEEEKWGHKFDWPTFPLDCMTGPKTLWINALALFTGFVSLIALIRAGLNWLFRNRPADNNILMLCYLYMTAIMFIVLLFNPRWTMGGTTSVHEASRYTFASPFFLGFLYYHTYERRYRVKDYIIILLLSNAFWLLFASYQHIQHVLYFNFGTLLLMLYMANADKRYTLPAMILFAINVYIQIWFFQFFIGVTLPA